MLEEHENVTLNASARIDEISAEQDGIMASARDLTSQFCEMASKYRGPGQISLSSLAALKERLETNTSKPPADSRRGETAVSGISATPLSSTPSGSTTCPSSDCSPAAPPRSQAGAPPTNLQSSSQQQHLAASQAPQSGPAAACGTWIPQPHSTPHPLHHPQASPSEPQPLPDYIGLVYLAMV